MSLSIEIDADQLADGIDPKAATRDVAREWFDDAQETLLERGDEHEFEVFPVVQAAKPPSWTGDSWEFSFDHVAAVFFERGTQPHVIRPVNAEVLLFEWPDAPPEVREKFEPLWSDPSHFLDEPEVMFPEVEHPGTPALRFLRDSVPR